MPFINTVAIIISLSLLSQPLTAPEIRPCNIITNHPRVMYDVKVVETKATAPVAVEVAPKGKWVTVIATAYSPNDKIDSNHPSCKDDFTASMTRISKNPYGVAIPMRKDARGRSTVPVIADYGMQIYIPSGNGYLDSARKEDRIFVCDDTGGKINQNTRKTGIPHIDLRFKSESAAKKFGKKKIEVFVYDE